MTTPKTDEAGIRQTIRALKAAGYALGTVDDGGGEPERVRTEDEAVKAITAVDNAYLYVIADEDSPSPRMGHIWFVLGNEPFEVIADHSLTLSPVLDPLMERWDPEQ